MKRLTLASAVVGLGLATTALPAHAQDFVGPVAAAADQFGQGLAESMAGGPGIFVTAQGRAPMPTAAASVMTLTIKGDGKTAVEAIAERNALLEKVRAVANRYDVSVDVGETSFEISETPDWMTGMGVGEAAMDTAGQDSIEGGQIVPAITPVQSETTATVSASVPVKIGRPNEARLPGFIDALVEAGVTDLNESLTGNGLGAIQPFLALLGLDATNDPGEAVWNAATADGVTRARAQATAIAAASGRPLGQVRHVSVLMRSHDGENALVSVAVRFTLE